MLYKTRQLYITIRPNMIAAKHIVPRLTLPKFEDDAEETAEQFVDRMRALNASIAGYFAAIPPIFNTADDVAPVVVQFEQLLHQAAQEKNCAKIQKIRAKIQKWQKKIQRADEIIARIEPMLCTEHFQEQLANDGMPFLKDFAIKHQQCENIMCEIRLNFFMLSVTAATMMK